MSVDVDLTNRADYEHGFPHQLFTELRAEGAEDPRPIIYDGALTAWIDRSQRGALTPDVPEPTFWDALAASGRAFVSGLVAEETGAALRYSPTDVTPFTWQIVACRSKAPSRT